MSAPTVTPEAPPAEKKSNGGLRGAADGYFARIRGGDVGALPAVLSLLVLVIVFTLLRPDTFTSALNFSNLLHQASAVIVIAMGLVFVLLLGEIDLSAGWTAGVGAAVMGVFLTNHGWPWYLSVVACLVTGVVVGTVLGLLVSYVGIP